MELEDLKQIWKSHEQGYEPKKEADIAFMLKGTSNSIISKLKRNVWLELIFTVACCIALGMFTITLESGAVLWTVVSLLVLFAAYLFYYIKKLILLGKFDASDENMKASLQSLHKKLSAYVSFYKKSYGILYPVYFFLGILFGAVDTGMDNFVNRIKDPLTLASLVLLTGLFFIITIAVTNFYLKKLYGNHLNKLKALLDELKG
jgi:hypothetical protein